MSPRRTFLTISWCCLHPLLLRPQDQEIHDHEDEDERQQRHQQAVAAQRAGGLRKGGRNQHRVSPSECSDRPALRLRRADLSAEIARTIAAAAPIATPLWPHSGPRLSSPALAAAVPSPAKGAAQPNPRPWQNALQTKPPKPDRRADAHRCPTTRRARLPPRWSGWRRRRRPRPISPPPTPSSGIRTGAGSRRCPRQPGRHGAAQGHRPRARHAGREHRALRQALPANNALLWGARGMGKSSLVKAVHAAVNARVAARDRRSSWSKSTARTSRACPN